MKMSLLIRYAVFCTNIIGICLINMVDASQVLAGAHEQKYPIQPTFVVKDYPHINPVQMSSMSVGISLGKIYPGFTHALLKPLQPHAVFFKYEYPEPHRKTSLGVQCVMGFQKEVLGIYSIKSSMRHSLGTFALDVAPKVGFIATDILMPDQYTGMALGMSGGLDWYVNQWFGFFVEASYQYNLICFKGTDLCKPIDYPIFRLTFGVKTTLFA